MGKRFIDSKLWTDSWFRKLQPDTKLFWVYLFSVCDNAGVWEVDFELASILLGLDINDSILHILNQNKKRVRPIKNGRYWFIEDFIPFQYGELSDSCHPHKRVKELLKDHNISLQTRVLSTLEEKEEEKEEEKDFGKTENLFDVEANFEKVWARYPARDGKKEAIRHFRNSVRSLADFQRLEKSLDNYLAHLALPKNAFKQPKNGKTWFNNWQDWENWQEPEKEETSEERDARIIAKYAKS